MRTMQDLVPVLAGMGLDQGHLGDPERGAGTGVEGLEQPAGRFPASGPGDGEVAALLYRSG